MNELHQDETTKKYFNPLTKKITSSFMNNLLKDIKKLKVNSSLDVGCGTGYLTKKICSIVPNITGCDLDKRRLEIAKQYTKDKIKFIQNNGTKLPFDDDSFELVTCFEVLEHVPSYIDLIQECKRVSKRYVMFTVPHEPYFRLANFLRFKNFLNFGNPPDHLNHFSKRKFWLILKKYLKIKT